MIDYTTLIPELPDWNAGRGIEIMDWLGCMGSFEVAIGYTELFWPHFTEREGCIIRTTELPQGTLQTLLAQTDGDISHAESVLNEIGLYDLHTGTVIQSGEKVEQARPEPTWEQLVYLGERMCEMWQAKLDRDFPERSFVVRLNNAPIREVPNWPQANSVDDLAVTAFQNLQLNSANLH